MSKKVPTKIAERACVCVCVWLSRCVYIVVRLKARNQTCNLV